METNDGHGAGPRKETEYPRDPQLEHKASRMNDGSSKRPCLPEVVEDIRSFAALESEWNDLYLHSPRATPFQSWAWLYSWWESYGANHRLRLVALRDEGGLLVGLMPMMIRRKGGLAKLLFIGSGQSEYLDVIARGGWEDDVVRACSQTMPDLGPWRVADLHQIRPEALAWRLFKDWPGPRAAVWQATCPIIEVAPWEEMLAPLSRNLRSMARRSIRRAESDGLVPRLADADRVERAAERFMELHREMWEGRGIAPEHITGRFEAHIKSSARRMTEAGVGGVSEFWRDGEVIASHIVVFGGGSVGHYLSGATQDALGRYQMSSLFVWDGANLARERGEARYDFLRGEEAYKMRWRPKAVPNHRVILGGNPVLWAPYAAFHTLHSKARRFADSEDAPPWIQKAKETYKLARRKLRLGQLRRE